MGMRLDDLIKTFTAERQEMIKKETDKLISEYSGLMEFRKAAGLSQKVLAGRMSMSQENISRLEKRTDMHLSTLRKYVEALGGQMEILITIPEDESSNVYGKLKI